jgi:GTPase SAR1 family protein
MCEFQEYTVSKYGEESKIAGKLWINTLNEIKDAIEHKKNVVITIIGEPGMGKTTLLNAVYNELKDRSYIIYLDLVNSPSVSSSAWDFIKDPLFKMKVEKEVFNILFNHQKEIGYVSLAKFREFPNWLRHLCKKKTWNKDLAYAERLYCMPYNESIEGLIEFVKDLSHLGISAILFDEVKVTHLSELHKLINELNLPLIVTMIPEIFSEVKDKALERRLKEKEIELKLSEEDKKDILKAYCEDYYEELLNLQGVEKASTTNELLDKAREAYLTVLAKCNTDYKKEECIRQGLSNFLKMDNIQVISTKFEKKIRDGLMDLQGELKIDYVHNSGKKIKEKGIIVDIFFKKGNVEYLGDVKLSNEKYVDNIVNMKKLEDLEKDGGYTVRKFIVTNQPNMDLKDFKIIHVTNEEIMKILEGDIEKRNELVRKIIKEVE